MSVLLLSFELTILVASVGGPGFDGHLDNDNGYQAFNLPLAYCINLPMTTTARLIGL
jgi:hypothetical protein